MVWNPVNESYALPPTSAERNASPVSASDIGNLFIINPGEISPIVQESAVVREVTLFNVGSVPLSVSSIQIAFPRGLRLCSGEPLQIKTKQTIWVAAPPTFKTVAATALVRSFGYVTATVEN